MNFWKKHAVLKTVIIALFFVLGLVMTFVGWKMTGQLLGLGLMIAGIIFLLAALLVYNSAYKK